MDSKMDNWQLTLANRKIPSTKENLNLKWNLINLTNIKWWKGYMHNKTEIRKKYNGQMDKWTNGQTEKDNKEGKTDRGQCI